MKAGYYFRNKIPGTHRNDWAICILCDVQNWPERSRSFRGCTPLNLEIARQMTSDEIEDAERVNKFRVVFYKYKSWAGFIEDEIRILGKEHPFIKDLIEIRKKYDLIPEHEPGQKTLF